jgi:hypothetical protein
LAASTNPFDISKYRTETDGKSLLKERNSKLLGDDYVKFFCFSEQIINKNNEGILAFVTNNGFLENPTFRGMRASLLCRPMGNTQEQISKVAGWRFAVY